MREMIQARKLALPTELVNRKLKSQTRYKQDYNQSVWETSHFAPNIYVLPDSPSLRANMDSAAESLSMKEYNKPQSRNTDPFRIINVQKNTVNIDENGIPNTVSVDHVTDVSRRASPLQVSNKSPSTSQQQPKVELDLTNNEYAVELVIESIGNDLDTK